MKTVSNNFKTQINEFGRQLDTKIYDWYKPGDDYVPIEGNTTQNGTPTPDSPVSVVNVTGDNEVVVCGKNLYDKSTTYSTGGSNQNIANDIILKPSTNYYFYTGKTWTTLYLYDENNQQTRQLGGWQSASYISFTTASNEVKGKFTFYAQNNVDVTTYDFTGIQLEQNNQATTYEPYVGKTYHINLGKNLLNISNSNVYINNVNNPDITTTYDESKNRVDFQVNSLPSQYSQAGYYYAFKTIIGKTYKVKSIWENTSSTPIANVRICSDKTGTTVVNNMTSNTEYSFTATQETYYFRVWITTTIGTGYLEYAIVSASDTTFSPYKTPIELCKIGDYQDFIKKSTGKNLFDKDNANIFLGYVNSSNVITADTGTTSIYIPCKPNTTYTIQKTGGSVFSIAYCDNIPTSGGSARGRILNNTSPSLTITTDSTAKYLISAIGGTAGYQDILNTIQIEKGSQATEYEPYGKVWYIKKNVGKVVLDGDEDNLTLNSTSSSLFDRFKLADVGVINNSTIANIVVVKSNYFNGITFNERNNRVGIFNLANNSTKDIFINVDKSLSLNTLPLFKTWLSTHNTSVYYVLANPTYTTITDDELISQLEAIRLLKTYDRDNIYNINPNFHTNIMETLMKAITIENDELIDIDDEVDVYSGVKVGNDYEYVKYGHYNVKEYEKDENEKTYKMKCYDDMIKTMVDYDLEITYPISVKNLLIAICNHFGFTLNTQTFVNDDNMITTDVFSDIGLTYRDVLSELAAATCSTIEIENGIMYLKYPIDTDLVIDEDILNDKNVAISKKYGPVNRLVISRIGNADYEFREDTTSINYDGLTEINIKDKQIFSTEETRDNLIDEMWNYIKGFEYYLCNLDTQGLMYVEALDKFGVSIDNVVYQTMALNDETNIDSGINEEVYTEEPEVNQDKYKYTKSADKSVKNAYIEVDKQNAKIEMTATEAKTYTDDKTNTLRTDLQGQIGNVDTDLQTYKQTVSTTFQQTTESFDFRFTNITDLVGQVSDIENEHYEELIKYIRFVNGVIILGEEGNELTAELSNNRLSFKQNGNEVAYISNQKLYITDTEVLQNIIIGNFAFIPRSNGSLSFRKVR